MVRLTRSHGRQPRIRSNFSSTSRVFLANANIFVPVIVFHFLLITLLNPAALSRPNSPRMSGRAKRSKASSRLVPLVLKKKKKTSTLASTNPSSADLLLGSSSVGPRRTSFSVSASQLNWTTGLPNGATFAMRAETRKPYLY